MKIYFFFNIKKKILQIFRHLLVTSKVKNSRGHKGQVTFYMVEMEEKKKKKKKKT